VSHGSWKDFTTVVEGGYGDVEAASVRLANREVVTSTKDRGGRVVRAPNSQRKVGDNKDTKKKKKKSRQEVLMGKGIKELRRTLSSWKGRGEKL